MLNACAVPDFLDLLYTAPASPDLWGEVLTSLTDLVGADSAWLARLDDVGEGGEGLTCRLDPSAQTRYFEHYARLDPFRDRPTQPLGIFDDEAYLPKSSLVRSEFYNDFMRPLDAFSILKMRLFHDGNATSVVHLNRNEGRGAFDRDSMAVAADLYPHLARASQLSATLRAAGRKADYGHDLLMRIDRPAMLLDRDGLVCAANAAAEMLFEEGRVLALKGRRLAASPHAINQKLGWLLADAVGVDGAPGLGGTIMIGRDGLRCPLLLNLAPLRSDTASWTPGRPVLLVTVGNPNSVRRPELAILTEMFKLTSTEGRIALEMMEGLSLHDVAAKLSISLNTVRNHVKNIFAKTEVSRQAELVALLMRIAAAL